MSQTEKLSWSIGNGQVNDAMLPDFEVSKTLNCLKDTAKIIEGKVNRVGGGMMNDNAEKKHETVVLENHPQDSRIKIKDDGVFQTMGARQGRETDPHTLMIIEELIARRLTPLECTRLQGFPDGWVDIGDWADAKGKQHKDSDGPKYKALGNSIALPFWQWMAYRMVDVLKADGVGNPTMASLFDGIGGFPLVFQNAGCKPVWASEIEEFPIAVTKIRFPEEGE